MRTFLFCQIAIVSIWATMMIGQTRRLFRLARPVGAATRRDQALRRRIERIWWWLGRDEFWRGVQKDCVRGLQLTLLILILAWGQF
jgi:hypothetical protein